jgi:hypothetical protein
MRLDGFEALQRAIRTAPDLVKEGASEAVEKTAYSCSARARALAPYRTGRLKSAIGWRARGLSGRVTVDRAIAPYWKHVEHGTEKWGGKAYIRPAAELESNPYLERIRAVGTSLERAWPTGLPSKAG